MEIETTTQTEAKQKATQQWCAGVPLFSMVTMSIDIRLKGRGADYVGEFSRVLPNGSAHDEVKEQFKAHVAAMLRAVNSYDAMREALERIADIGEGSTTANSLPNIARIARAALGKGQQPHTTHEASRRGGRDDDTGKEEARADALSRQSRGEVGL